MLEPCSLYAGTPARRIKTIDPERLENMSQRIARDYLKYAGWYRE
jgi:hypothetical protein